MLDKKSYNKIGQRNGYWEIYRSGGTLLWYKANYINNEMYGYFIQYGYISLGQIIYNEYYAR